jgi:hypothetical protein
MSVTIDYIVNKINEIIRFSNETRHATHIAIPDTTLVKEIFKTGVTTHGLLNPDIKQLTYITERDIIGKSRAGKNRKKATRKKAIKY